MTRLSFTENANYLQKACILAVFLAFSALFLVNCAPRISSHGHLIDPMELEKIVPGTSTRQDVLTILGRPSFEGAFNEDKIYYLSQIMREPVGGYKEVTDREVYIMSFDKAGLLQSIDIQDERTGIKVITLDSTTPTPGDNFGVLEQVFSNLRRRSDSDQ